MMTLRIELNAVLGFVLGLSVTVTAGTAPARGADHGRRVAAIVEGLEEHARRCAKQERTFALGELLDAVDAASASAQEFDATSRGRIIAALGPVLVQENEQIEIGRSMILDGVRVEWGDDPRPMLKGKVLRLLATMNDGRALPYLQDYCRTVREEIGYKSRRDLAVQLIMELGGAVPEPMMAGPPATQPSAAELEARRKEVDDLIRRLGEPEPARFDYNTIILRLGDLRDQRAVGPIIEALARDTSRRVSIIRGDAYRALGQIGGPQGKTYLMSIVANSMPPDADLGDRFGQEPVNRAAAARSLSNFNDPDVVALLTRVAEDQSQYDGVRVTCQSTATAIRRRIALTTRPASAPTSQPTRN